MWWPVPVSVHLVLLALMSLAFVPKGSKAETFFVRTSGQDSADGRSPATALRTIGAAARRISNPGTVVIIGPGTYEEGDIAPARNGIRGRSITFRGDPTGQATGDPPGAVRIVVTPPATTGFLLLGRRFVEIVDLRVEGGSDAGIQVRPSADGTPSAAVTVRRVSLRGSAKRGIDMRSVAGAIWIEQCEVRENGTGGISIEGDGTTTTVVVTGNQVETNGGPGVFLRLVQGGQVSANEIRNNSGAGIALRASTLLEVRQNRLSANGEQAVNAGVSTGVTEPVEDLVVENNVAEGAGKTIFLVVGSGEVRFQGNRAVGWSQVGGSGASFEGVGDNVLSVFASNNHVERTADDCFLFKGAATAVAAGNSAANCGGNGIRFESVRVLEATGNRVDTVSRSGIVVSGGDAAEFINNEVVDASGGGIVVNASGSPLRSVRIRKGEVFQSGGVGVSVQGATAVRIAGVTIQDSPGDGVNLREVERVEIRRVSVARLGGRGLTIGRDDRGGARSVRVASSQWRTLGTGALKILAEGSVAISDNEILDSGGPGISLTGQSPSWIDIANNTVGLHEADGVFIRGARSGTLANNRVFSNRQSGIVLRSTDRVYVGNNLVYANRGEGLAIGVGGEPSSRTVVIFNTLYGNGLRGLRIDGPSDSTAIEGGWVLNNIIAGNREGGVAIARSAMADFVSGFNVNPDGYVADTRRNDFDIREQPLFISPEGPDGILGEEGFQDDNFRLAHRRTGQPKTSPAVDAGSDLATTLGVSGGTTAADGLPDTGRADVGFHYGLDAGSLVRTVPLPLMPLFVRAAGSDTNSGLAPWAALSSIRSAFERAVAGVTVVVGPGTYREGDIRIRNWSGRVTFLGDSSGFLTGDVPGPVLVDASGFDTGFVLLNGGPVTVRGFHVTGAGQAGIQVRAGADGAQVIDNVVFSNHRRGIEISGAHEVTVRNNLVYANGTGGIQLQGCERSVIEGNTIYANGANGILVGTRATDGAAPYSALRRNIVMENGERVPAANGVQIQVELNSREGFESAYNVVWGRTPFAGNTPRSDSDLVIDPLFENPAGVDGVLGGDGFADDDFTLRQLSPDGTVSAAVDLDFDTVDGLGWGTTSKYAVPDLGPADAGYHYPLFHPHVRVGQTIFVRRSGDDRSDGATPERAVRSIERALELTQGSGWVVVGPGRYSVTTSSMGGKPGDGTTLILWGDETGLLTGDAPGPVTLDFGGRRGLTLRGSAVVHGLWLVNARNSGLRVLGTAKEVWVRHSVFCGNEGDGLWSTASAVDLMNNLFCGNRGWGVRLTPKRGSGYVRVVNATIAQNTSGGIWAVDRARSHPQIRLANNVIAGNGGPGAMLHVGSQRVVPWGYNLNSDGYSKARVSGPGELAVPPQFEEELHVGPPACPPPTAYRVSYTSPARDAGIGELRLLGLLGRSATVDRAPDRNRPDLGYHAPIAPNGGIPTWR